MQQPYQSSSARTLWVLFFMLFVYVPNLEAAPPKNAKKPLTGVVVQIVTAQEVNPPMESVGRVEAVQSVDLTARVQGYLDQVSFTEGERVRRGDILYVIEQAPYRAQVNADKALVAKAEAALDYATKYLKRLQSTREASVAQTDLDTAENAQLGAEAGLKEAQANLQISNIDLGYTTIKAPISGRIGKNAFTRGNLVDSTSGSLARIVQTDPIRVVYSVSENDFVDVKMEFMKKGVGQKDTPALIPRLRLPNGSMYPLAGRTTFVDNEVDPQTGTIAIRAEFDNPDELLLPGEYVTVLNAPAQGEKQAVVPQSAVQEDKKGRYVYTVDADNHVQRKEIVTGSLTGTFWAVTSGIKAGERVVVQGVQKIRQGQEVTVTVAEQAGR
ncbi:efflux RND transporter periplasmic adaptor subunit [Desulfoplanes sp.]